MNFFKIFRAIRKLPPGVQSLIFDVISAVASGKDPESAAKDAKRAALVHAFDATMRRKRGE